MGRRDEARKAFEEAKKICCRDRKWNFLKRPSDPIVDEVIRIIQMEIDKLPE
jgi:hypothetical protein